MGSKRWLGANWGDHGRLRWGAKLIISWVRPEVKWRNDGFRGRNFAGIIYKTCDTCRECAGCHWPSCPGTFPHWKSIEIQQGFEITRSQATNWFNWGWAQSTLRGVIAGFSSWLKLLMSIAPHLDVHGKSWTSWAYIVRYNIQIIPFRYFIWTGVHNLIMLSLDPGNSLDKASQLPAGIFSHHDFMGQDHLLILSAWGLSSPDELDLFLGAKGENLRTRKSTGTRLDPLLTHKVFFIFLKSFNLPRNVDVATPRVSELWNSHFRNFLFHFFHQKNNIWMQIVIFFDPSRNVHYNDFKVHFPYIPGKSKEFPEKTPKETGGPPSIIRNLLLGIFRWFQKDPPTSEVSFARRISIAAAWNRDVWWSLFRWGRSPGASSTENHWRKGGRHFPTATQFFFFK